MIIDFFGYKVYAESGKTEHIKLVPKVISDEIYARVDASKPAQFRLNKESLSSLLKFEKQINPSGIVNSDWLFGIRPFPICLTDIKISYAHLTNHYDARVIIFDDYEQLIKDTLNVPNPISEYVCVGVVIQDLSNIKDFNIGTSIFFPIIVSSESKCCGSNLFGYRGKINANIKKEGCLSSYRDEVCDTIMTQWNAIQNINTSPYTGEIISKNDIAIGKAKKGQPQKYKSTYTINTKVLEHDMEDIKGRCFRVSGYWKKDKDTGKKKYIKGYWKERYIKTPIKK